MLSVLRPFPSPLLSRHGIDLDFPLLAGCLALLGLGLVMVTSASSGGGGGAVGQPAVLLRPSPDLPGDRPDFLRPDHDGPDGHLAALGLEAVAGRLRPAGAGDHPRYRPRGERLDALDRLRPVQHPAFGDRQGLRGDLHGRLPDPPPAGGPGKLDGLLQALRGVAADGRPAAARAGLRRHRGNDGRCRGHAVPRRGGAVPLRPDGAAGGRRGGPAGSRPSPTGWHA